MQKIKELIFSLKLVVIARRLPIEKITGVVSALQLGGVKLLETTYDHTLDNPISANCAMISRLVREFGSDMYFGAGTVLTVDEVRAAADAGARYIVSPNCNPAVIEETKRLGLVSIPGAMTPTEVETAFTHGGDIIKLFPADDLGYHYIRNILAPLAHIPLLASGGVNVQTIPEYFNAGIKAVATGISILKPELIATNDWKAIENLAKQHVEAIEAFDR
jgi:2-dehydro-3-deoxyphosphogluconate aldolase/(4S)-4-hydroxy-2-oxoglutarate aldolase